MRRFFFGVYLLLLFGATWEAGAVEVLYRKPTQEFVEGDKKWFTEGDETIHVKYVGETKDGVPHGAGTETVSFDPYKGSEYVGEYKDGKMHGQGTLTSANGAKYVGEFKDNKKHGQGTYTLADGTKYFGEYVGEFKDNKMHGQGMLTVADGGKFVGEWKSTQPWAGVEYGPSGEVVAIYKEGVPQ